MEFDDTDDVDDEEGDEDQKDYNCNTYRGAYSDTSITSDRAFNRTEGGQHYDVDNNCDDNEENSNYPEWDQYSLLERRIAWDMLCSHSWKLECSDSVSYL